MQKSNDLYIQACDLSLMATFFVIDETIRHIDLNVHHFKGLCWRIISNRPNQPLETMISKWMREYASGVHPQKSLPIFLNDLPEFTLNVLEGLGSVPFGKTVSYQQLATIAGRPKASRAVGNACGRNPCPLVIPCHRVIASSGSIGGFSLDLNIKKHLIEFETKNSLRSI